MEDEPQRFNIGTYISAASPHDLETARAEWPERHRCGRKLECGTSACLVGHLPVLFPDSFFWSSGENVRNALVRLKENNSPKEDVSFPNFKFQEIVNEEWDDSNFKDILEHKFLFVFFQIENEQLVLRKVKFWNMPFADILEAEKVWARTKDIVSEGKIVKEVIGLTRYTNFPNKSFNSVSHVRPHAANAADTYPLPTKDKLTKVKEYTKQCFWLNSTYIKDEIYLK
jgi:hypothetical protein